MSGFLRGTTCIGSDPTPIVIRGTELGGVVIVRKVSTSSGEDTGRYLYKDYNLKSLTSPSVVENKRGRWYRGELYCKSVYSVVMSSMYTDPKQKI